MVASQISGSACANHHPRLYNLLYRQQMREGPLVLELTFLCFACDHRSVHTVDAPSDAFLERATTAFREGQNVTWEELRDGER